MKEQKKAKPSGSATDADILANLDIEKYSGPEYASPKLKMVEEKFRKQAELKAKQAVHH